MKLVKARLSRQIIKTNGPSTHSIAGRSNRKQRWEVTRRLSGGLHPRFPWVVANRPEWVSIEGNHLAPMLTHNPPQPSLCDGCWVVAGRYWCETVNMFMCLHGLRVCNHPSLPSPLQIILSVNPSSCPDITLTSRHLLHFVSISVCDRTVLITCMQSLKRYLVHLQSTNQALVTYTTLSATTQNSNTFTSIDSRL